MADFHDSMLKGEATKGLIKVLLQKSVYTVYPYGYESTLADIRDKLYSKEVKKFSHGSQNKVISRLTCL